MAVPGSNLGLASGAEPAPHKSMIEHMFDIFVNPQWRGVTSLVWSTSLWREDIPRGPRQIPSRTLNRRLAIRPLTTANFPSTILQLFWGLSAKAQTDFPRVCAHCRAKPNSGRANPRECRLVSSFLTRATCSTGCTASSARGGWATKRTSSATSSDGTSSLQRYEQEAYH